MDVDLLALLEDDAPRCYACVHIRALGGSPNDARGDLLDIVKHVFRCVGLLLVFGEDDRLKEGPLGVVRDSVAEIFVIDDRRFPILLLELPILVLWLLVHCDEAVAVVLVEVVVVAALLFGVVGGRAFVVVVPDLVLRLVLGLVVDLWLVGESLPGGRSGNDRSRWLGRGSCCVELLLDGLGDLSFDLHSHQWQQLGHDFLDGDLRKVVVSHKVGVRCLPNPNAYIWRV